MLLWALVAIRMHCLRSSKTFSSPDGPERDDWDVDDDTELEDSVGAVDLLQGTILF